jgi:hypothetical protein
MESRDHVPEMLILKAGIDSGPPFPPPENQFPIPASQFSEAMNIWQYIFGIWTFFYYRIY